MPRATKPHSQLHAPSAPCPKLNHAGRMSYRIGRGELGVLTFEPYKSYLLPLWRFRTPEIARQSSRLLWDEFEKFAELKDFVGMDMTRKFIQMGFTRARRYSNHKGGRKYDGDGKVLPRSTGHADQSDKEEASVMFKEVWERCKRDETYLRLKGEFQKDQKAWDKEQKDKTKEPS
ncbi:hypothetical protein AAFC00_006938 [Neodothiora populina]|uniref:Cytoplasmic protein n=1 Tax=Neodothiora populina TaxID=2781224 RepID=A0ABR3PBN7_9PEZI